jgi:hypothetical protein
MVTFASVKRIAETRMTKKTGREAQALEQALWAGAVDRGAEQQREDRASRDQASPERRQQKNLGHGEAGDALGALLAHLLEHELRPQILSGRDPVAFPAGHGLRIR